MEPTARRCLVVVDVQRDFCDDMPGASLGVRFGGDVAGLIGDHLRRSIDAYDLVVLTGDWHVDPGPHFSDQPDYRDTWPPHCVAGTLGAEWHPQLEAALVEVAGRVPITVIRKGMQAAAYSGFEGCEEVDASETSEPRTLDELLHGAAIDELDIVGIATDHCVVATATDALASGYATTILAGLTAAVDVTSGLECLAALAAAGAVVEGTLPS
ncbi:MAG: isochorismatase family protein [Ilumatobacteraceae bacterium]